MKTRSLFAVSACLWVGLGCIWAGRAAAADQVWRGGEANIVWSTNAANWDVDAFWLNGNSAIFDANTNAVFSGAIDVSATVTVANVTFQTNGYVIADANKDGALSVAGAPSVITVVNASDTGTVSAAIGGYGGLTKAGAGVLNLTVTNSYAGTTTVSAGTLRLASAIALALGSTAAGSHTVVETNATLDLNGCYVNGTTGEKFTIAGAGADGKGAIVNNGPDMVNRDMNELILQADAVVGGLRRMDFGVCTGNGKTLTKKGAHQLCMKNVSNVEIVINEGTYTLLADNRALGGTTPGNTTVNGGTLNAWNTMTVSERIFFNGGTISQGNVNNVFYLSGLLTVNSNTFVNSGSGRGVEISGFVDGAGGFTQAGPGWFIVTGSTNAYSGPTVVNGGCPLYVGRTNLYAGVLGTGTVTNNGTLYGYSSLISQGNIVNAGTLYCNTGLLASGSVVNNGNLYVDRGGTFVFSNAFAGFGTIYLRFNGDMALSGNTSTNGGIRVGMGTLTLTNGATFVSSGEIQVADLLNVNYIPAYPYPTNRVMGLINVPAGCALYAQAITFGNVTNPVSGGVTGILNQTGGSVVTTGKSAEDNGIRLGHYPQARSFYNMMGGTLTVGANWDLSCATDGNGWFNMTGGEVFAKRVMLNERGGDGGYGRLTVSGGVLNVGSLTGSGVAISNGIVADPGADYLVEFGGAGGTVRAVTNILIAVTNTLYGAGADAITFDSAGWVIQVTGRMEGPGGLNKSGSGTLALSGANTYSGPTRIMEGVLTPATASVLPAGGEVQFGVFADGSCGVLHATNDFSLAGLTVGAANPDLLDTSKSYTVITCDGELSGDFAGDTLPGPWYLYCDWESDTVQLRAAIGTLIMME